MLGSIIADFFLFLFFRLFLLIKAFFYQLFHAVILFHSPFMKEKYHTHSFFILIICFLYKILCQAMKLFPQILPGRRIITEIKPPFLEKNVFRLQKDSMYIQQINL